MQAGFGEMQRFAVRELSDLECLHAVEESPGRVQAVGVLVAQRAGGAGRVPLFAAGHAGAAAYTDVQVDYQGELSHFAPPFFLPPPK